VRVHVTSVENLYGKELEGKELEDKEEEQQAP
jgi:hypothetical protein